MLFNPVLRIYKIVCSSGIQNFSLPAAGIFSRSRLRGTQEARLYTTVQVWVQIGLRGACSGRSKSRNLASTQGIAFRPARASQDNGNPIFRLDASTEQLPNKRSLGAFPVLTATDTNMRV